MSSVPPNTPPGGGQPPYPPYDPKTQWRVYREQQKAAWRAQRDAWKAQRTAMRANYAGVYGPRVPSMVGPVILIGAGVVALLVLSGRIDAGNFWTWYAHWWPLLLIGAGLALLGEWALDMRRPTPVRRGGSFVGLLILLAILGFGAAGWKNAWGPFRAQFGDNGDDFFNIFGLPEHDVDQQVLNSAIPANSTVEIENPRGDVSVTAGDTATIQVQAHAVAYASSDADANKIFAAEAAHVTVSGSAVLVKSESNNSGRLNLTITVPQSARVTVNAGRGDVTAAGLGAGININADHGDAHLSGIAGPVQVHFSNSRHDFSAHQVDGDVTLDGDCSDLTLSEIKGRITQSGEILGDVHIEDVGGAVSLHTTVTDLELAGLPGDLTLDSDDLRVTDAKGPVRVTTHSKDIDLSQIYGDVQVEDRDDRVAVEPAGNYNLDVKNDKGDVEVTLPPDAAANVDGRTRNGDIVSDFPLVISGDEDKTISGRIGAGGPRISLTTENGDLGIKKGSGFAAQPPSVTAAPEAGKGLHLKAPRKPPAQPVTQ
jgi:DUF4097 and DUF4098 domain-containing protein YvlB